MLIISINNLIMPDEPSIEVILTDLKKEIKNNPKLKILTKVKFLLESVAGELVQGGPFRAWSPTGAYHFSRKCKLYPERVRPEEMDKILCYNTREEAEGKHEPCKTCLKAQSILTNNIEFMGEE